MSDIKLCKNCVHFIDGMRALCARKKSGKIDPVYGFSLYESHANARDERSWKGIFGARCGPAGQFWEPKE